MYVCAYACAESEGAWEMRYGEATISRLLRIIGLFCKRALEKKRYSAKETYNFKEPTNRSYPIVHHLSACVRVQERDGGGRVCVCVCAYTCMCVRMRV